MTRNLVEHETYAYDEKTRRIQSQIKNDPIRTYEYNRSDELKYAGNKEYIHDEKGFLQRISRLNGMRTNLKYWPNGQLSEVLLPDNTKITYALDAFGRRAMRSVDGHPQIYMLRDGLNKVLACYDGDHNLTHRFEYVGNRPLFLEHDGKRYYLICDHTNLIRR